MKYRFDTINLALPDLELPLASGQAKGKSIAKPPSATDPPLYQERSFQAASDFKGHGLSRTSSGWESGHSSLGSTLGSHPFKSIAGPLRDSPALSSQSFSPCNTSRYDRFYPPSYHSRGIPEPTLFERISHKPSVGRSATQTHYERAHREGPMKALRAALDELVRLLSEIRDDRSRQYDMVIPVEWPHQQASG